MLQLRAVYQPLTVRWKFIRGPLAGDAELTISAGMATCFPDVMQWADGSGCYQLARLPATGGLCYEWLFMVSKEGG